MGGEGSGQLMVRGEGEGQRRGQLMVRGEGEGERRRQLMVGGEGKRRGKGSADGERGMGKAREGVS